MHFPESARTVWKPAILAYASTKGALQTLVNTGAMIGPGGVCVNAVAPGVIDTDMSNLTQPEAAGGATLGFQAPEQIGVPEDMVDIVAFLSHGKGELAVPVSPSVAIEEIYLKSTLRSRS